jgi:predicted RecA/RadA family phage recombinase
MPQTTFKHGNYRVTDYLAGADISAGEVVLLGNLTGLTNGIAHHDIANAAVGSLAIGGGIYQCINLNNAADGAKVYWDVATDKVTTVSTNMSTFGFIVENGGGGANSACWVLHHPYV